MIEGKLYGKYLGMISFVNWILNFYDKEIFFKILLGYSIYILRWLD